MYPIAGPVNSAFYNNIEGQGSYYVLKSRYRQTHPYDLALPYSVQQYVTLSMETLDGWWNTVYANASTVSSDIPSPYFFDGVSFEADQAMNKALSKFRDRFSESSELLVAYAERKQSVDMITSRAQQLLSLAKAIAKRDVRGITRLLDRTTRKGNRKIISRAKGFAGAWLEFSFGWLPLVKDIGNAVNLLQSGIKDIPVWGKASVPFVRRRSWGTASQGGSTSAAGAIKCRIGANLRVDNPNLALANRLGFTNPASVVWELIPYSFVVDWFVPVQDFLGNFSSSHGISLVTSYNTVFCKGIGTYVAWVAPPYQEKFFKTTRAGLKVVRQNGIPSVVLRPKAPWQLSSWRAANAVSLLVGFLKSKS